MITPGKNARKGLRADVKSQREIGNLIGDMGNG